jgi:hypothetical protein
MAWCIEVVDGCAVVGMNTNKVNIQNNRFFADLHAAFDRLERKFNELPVVLTVMNVAALFQFCGNDSRWSMMGPQLPKSTPLCRPSTV